MKIPQLNMSRRIRRTPFTQKVEQNGVTGFTVVKCVLHCRPPKCCRRHCFPAFNGTLVPWVRGVG